MTTAPVKILIRVPSELAERIAAKASAKERSQNTVMVRALRDAVADTDKRDSEQ